MRLHAVVESYPPAVPAGSELAAHTLFCYLAARGWQVTVHVTRHPNAHYQLDGVQVVSDLYRSCDLVYTHLWEAYPKAAEAAKRAHAPIVYWIHANSPKPPRADIMIANTVYLKERWNADLVLHPPVTARDYEVEPGGRVTRVGLSEAKGAGLFWRLTRALPEMEFLGVVGAWGPQKVEVPGRNTWIWGTTLDMRRVYQETRVVIMPSDSHETYGRVGVESFASGIPVIAHPWQGIYEALGDAGIYADRRDEVCWVSLLECLADPAEYAYHSKLAKKRSRGLAIRSGRELKACQALLESIVRPSHTGGKGRTPVLVN